MPSPYILILSFCDILKIAITTNVFENAFFFFVTAVFANHLFLIFISISQYDYPVFRKNLDHHQALFKSARTQVLNCFRSTINIDKSKEASIYVEPVMRYET